MWDHLKFKELKITEMQNVGSSKYLVNFYVGEKHKDGSEFYNLAIFKNRVKKNAFIAFLWEKYHRDQAVGSE